MTEVRKVGPGVLRQASIQPYRRKHGDPLERPLKVYTLDSTLASHRGAIATIQIPYEPLQPGPDGSLFFVDPSDDPKLNTCIDLDNPRILMNGGLNPNPGDHCFHQQMVYAVCAKIYARFQKALGRFIGWGFDGGKLCLRPHDSDCGENAFYDKERGRLSFGYYEAPASGIGRNAPKGEVYTCLSHDIVAHEFTHAILDGLRSHFAIPTGPDVLGFHEGFADLVAVFQHFTYRETVEGELRKADGNLEQSKLLASIAETFGLTTNRNGPLRCAIGAPDLRYRPDMEPHEKGSVLLTAVFEAFLRVFARKTEPFLRLAYRPPSGYMIAELVGFLAAKASELAEDFLSMCIRGIDYCPPVDLSLGEFLRAMITADRDLIPDDRWGYRDALIDAFAAHGIYPPGVPQLAEDCLAWQRPSRFLPLIPGLHFADLRFAGDPALPSSESELLRQAEALWDYAVQPYIAEEFGLAPPGSDGIEPPLVESIRTSRRIGPDGQILFDLVAEITQLRLVKDAKTGNIAKFFGGCTVILGPEGDVRYLISKNINNQKRLEAQLEFQSSSGYWLAENGTYKLRGYAHQLAHQRSS
jgi:hypothetical protein